MLFDKEILLNTSVRVGLQTKPRISPEFRLWSCLMPNTAPSVTASTMTTAKTQQTTVPRRTGFSGRRSASLAATPRPDRGDHASVRARGRVAAL